MTTPTSKRDDSGPQALPNPEAAWEAPHPPPPNLAATVDRALGRMPSRATVLSGGQANLNVLVDDHAVLRVYRRDPRAAALEATLLRRPWTTFRVPQVLEEGSDFLLLEYVPHEPVEADHERGAIVGRALAEVHERTYASPGLLSPALEIETPAPDALEAGLHHLTRGVSFEDSAGAKLRDAAMAALRRAAPILYDHATRATLLHGDWKPSNLGWTSDGELLVLDWEFARAGPPLADVGQLFRWDPGERFRSGFVEGYWGDGGDHAAKFAAAQALDLVNLVDLLARSPPGSRRESDVATLVATRVGAT